VEKAGMISLVKVRELDVDDDFSLRGPTLQKAIEVYHHITGVDQQYLAKTVCV